MALINGFLNESEKKGVGNLKSHSALIKGEVININVKNNVTYGFDVEKKFEIKIPSNLTIFDLRLAIAKKCKS